jgi:hypothetical protein
MQSSTRKRNKFFNSFPPLTFSSEEMLQNFFSFFGSPRAALVFSVFFSIAPASGLKINKTHWFGRKNPLFALNQLNCFHIHTKKAAHDHCERRKAVWCMWAWELWFRQSVYPWESEAGAFDHQDDLHWMSMKKFSFANLTFMPRSFPYDEKLFRAH